MIKCLIIIDARCKHEDGLEQLKIICVELKYVLIHKYWSMDAQFPYEAEKHRNSWIRTRNVTYFRESSSKLRNYFEFQKLFSFYTLVPITEIVKKVCT